MFIAVERPLEYPPSTRLVEEMCTSGTVLAPIVSFDQSERHRFSEWCHTDELHGLNYAVAEPDRLEVSDP